MRFGTYLSVNLHTRALQSVSGGERRHNNLGNVKSNGKIVSSVTAGLIG